LLVARLEVWGSMDARGAVRFLVDRGTTMRGLDGKPFEAVVENFSRTGFLFKADVELPPGTLLWIGLSGAGAREAKIVWREGTRHGCEFLMPLSQRDLRHAFRSQDEIVADLEAMLQRARAGRRLPAGD
jgi:PilZ domain